MEQLSRAADDRATPTQIMTMNASRTLPVIKHRSRLSSLPEVCAWTRVRSTRASHA